ncbi:O-Antigen ligase [Corynebacterium capitovis DSM 44611]|uniref:O-antigen ligase family protein n=1 Tax=Corynebacterium capitovis TaxID=131081 RepID=UPI000380CFE4|nr:O-antigen ligase family protein [Corynebacterium capitovis]WKD57211.1 O-Antigen ligase [Corynebacterium capitovis DSM 44611]
MHVLTAVTLAGVFFVISVRRPQTAVLCFLSLVPFHGLLTIFPVTSSFWKELAVLAILAGSFIAQPASDAGHYRAFLPWARPLAILIPFGVMSGVIVHGLWSFFPIKIAFFYLLLVFIIWRYPFTQRDKDRLISVLLITGTITAIYGLLQQMVGGERLVEMGYTWGEQVRTTGPLLRSFGTFNQPFPFGLYLMVALLAGTSSALLEPRRLRSRLFWPASLVMGAGLVFSVVRASYIGLFIGLIVLGVTQHRRVFKAVQIVAGIGIAALVVVLSVFSSSSSIQALSSSSSLQQRITHWAESFQLVLSHPLGTGLGNTGSAAQKTGPGIDVLNPPYQPDSQYLKILIELGLPGMALYVAVVAFMIWSMRQLLRQLPTSSIDYAFVCIALAATTAACISAVFATYLEIFPLDILFWVLPAIACCAPQTRSRSAGKPAAVAPEGSATASR